MKSLVVGDVVHPPVESVSVDVDVVSLDHSRPGIAGLVFLRVLVDLSQGFIGHRPAVSDNVGDAQRCLFLFLGQGLD